MSPGSGFRFSSVCSGWRASRSDYRCAPDGLPVNVVLGVGGDGGGEAASVLRVVGPRRFEALDLGDVDGRSAAPPAPWRKSQALRAASAHLLVVAKTGAPR